MLIGSCAQTFHGLVDLQAFHSPDNPAVISDSEVLTYGQLVSRANSLAHCLIEAGVTPQSFVGICVERSVHMIVGVLAILKAGAAYVPLDPGYPDDRLAHMVTDSGVACILAQTATIHALPKTQVKIILADMSADEHAAPAAPDITIRPNDLAYVIYTSGSTGVPKGVMLEHRNMMSFSEWTRERFSAIQSARVLAASSLSFDVSVFEFTTALASGGALVIVRNILDLVLKPLHEPISMIISVPSPVAELVRAGAVPPSVNTIILGGETLSHALANDIYATTNVQELVNVWGVTEDTVGTTSFVVPKVSHTDPPIGEAVEGRRIHLLDSNLQPVAAGTPGEICCTGSGVARGYLNRPELTNERFVPNPFDDSELMYRSGDLAVEGPDGAIRFLGRKDQQVKIRGYRIELGEIETALADHPLLAQVAVIGDTTAENTSLALFAVERQKNTATLSNVVEEFLAQRLPKHMLPLTLTILDAMPLGPTGKIDRKALLHLLRARQAPAQCSVMSCNEIEQTIAEHFSRLLGLERVGIDDNFFALGGQSLLATRAVVELKAVLPKEVAEFKARYGERALFTAFWRQPTVKAIADALQTLAPVVLSSSDVDGIDCLQHGVEHMVPFFLLHGVITNEAFYPWNLAHALGSDQPFYTLAPHGWSGSPVPDTIEAMAEEYLAKIRSIQPHGPYKFVGYCNGGLVCFEMARMLEAIGEEVTTLCLIAVPGHNARFSILESAVHLLRLIPGMDAARRRALFLHIRGGIVKCTDRKKNIQAASQRDRTLHATLSEETKARETAILRAIDAYVPKPYQGDAVLVYGEDDTYRGTHTPFADWKRLIPKLQTYTVPGDHHFIENRPDALVPYLKL